MKSEPVTMKSLRVPKVQCRDDTGVGVGSGHGLRVALVLNDDFSMVQFRGGLIKLLVGSGYEVVAIVPPGVWTDRLRELGAHVLTVEMYRFLSPLRDLRLFFSLWRAFRRVRPDIVHTMTIKPNVYGTIAARFAGVQRVVCLVSGAGTAFARSKGSVLSWLVRRAASTMYSVALHSADRCWFQNRDDFEEFVAAGIIPRAKGIVIRGSGVNLDEYRPGSVPLRDIHQLRNELKIPAHSRVVLMVAARLIWSKGVREFVDAADRLEASNPDVHFVLLAPRDALDRDAVPETFLSDLKRRNLTVIAQFREDVRTFYALAFLVTLPSYYREGVPRTLLEALAMGLPIITTDHPGCREAVIHEENGLLVPIRDGRALADAITLLLGDSDRATAYGAASRRLARTSFCEAVVARRVIDELYGYPDDRG